MQCVIATRCGVFHPACGAPRNREILGSMLELVESQKMAQQAIRSWCTAKLAPEVEALESGAMSPYPLMRDLADDNFGAFVAK